MPHRRAFPIDACSELDREAFRTPLSNLQVLALDCQATRDHVLEIGWSRTRAVEDRCTVESHLLRLPEGATIPKRVERVTGIKEEELASGETPETVWDSLAEMKDSPVVIHFSRFEEPHLRRLHHRCGKGDFPFRILCTHEIAKRLLPSLPRRGLRAVAGYFGHPVSELRRSAEHVLATVFVWRSLVERLRNQAAVETLDDLQAWLSEPTFASRERAFPMARRELPDKPGVYRMLRSNGEVLYVGKATSLKQRIATYFQKSASHAEHILEMLSQARDLDVAVTRSAVEAALLETDEIKRLSPPYNKALRAGDRAITFGTRDLESFSETPGEKHRVGPRPGCEVWRTLAGEVPDLFAGDPEAFHEGMALFRERLTCSLLAHGARLWALEPAEEEEFQLKIQYDVGARARFGPEHVAAHWNELTRRASHLVRRAHWLCLLSESKLRWKSRDGDWLFLRSGAPDYRKPFSERRKSFDLATYDRFTVLTREIRRLVTEGREVRLQIGGNTTLETAKLERLLRWV